MRPAPATVTAGLLAALLFAALTLVAGCGTANRTIGITSVTKSAVKTGKMTLSIKWPAQPVKVPGRVIPVAANSITVTVATAAGAQVTGSPVTVARPTTGNTTYTEFDNLAVGSYVVSAQAYPTTTGTGNVQAGFPNGQTAPLGSAAAPITVTAGAVTPLSVTMFATVESVVISSSIGLVNGGTPPIKIGESLPITATAYDANGNVIITTGAMQFSIGNTSIATVTPTTSSSNQVSTATLAAVANGTTTLTAQYVEPTVSPGTVPAGVLGSGIPSDAQEGTGAYSTIAVVVSPVGLAPSPAPWSKFHADAQNTGQAPLPASGVGNSVTGLTTGLQVWPSGTSPIVYSSPAISADGTTMYIGAETSNNSSNGFLYAITIATGKVKWMFPTGGNIDSSPAISANGTIYFGSADGYLYAVKDAASGSTPYTLAWKFSVGNPITGSPTIDKNGVLYVASDASSSGAAGSLYFIDSLSGHQILASDGHPIVFNGESVGFNCTPALNLAQTQVYVGGESGTLYAISTTAYTLSSNATDSPNVTGQYTFPDGIQRSSPVLGTFGGVERVYQATSGGSVYCFLASLVNAGPQAYYTATGQILATPAFSSANGVLYVATYDNTSGQSNSRLAVVDAVPGATTTLTEIERTAEINPNAAGASSYLFASSPAISSDGTMVYVGCENGFMYGFNVSGLTTGMTATGTSLPQVFGDAPAGHIIQTNGNSAQFPILVDSSPAIDASGHVYIGGFDGNVYVITE